MYARLGSSVSYLLVQKFCDKIGNNITLPIGRICMSKFFPTMKCNQQGIYIDFSIQYRCFIL